MQIIIDNYDFWNMEAEKYWSPTKNQNLQEIVNNAIFSGDYTLSEKVDGDWRMLIKDMEGNFHLRGRSESVNGGYADKIDWVPHIKEELKDIPNGTVLLGEMYLDSKRGSRNVTTIMGCLVDKALARQEKGEKLSYYVFDILAYDGKDIKGLHLEDRIKTMGVLKTFCQKYVSGSTYIKDPTKMTEYIAQLLAAGREGVILKRLNGIYEPGKRTARKSIKVKKELAQEIDCYATGAYKPATILYTGKNIADWTYWMDERTGEKFYGNRYNDYLESKVIVPITKPFYYGWASAIELAIWRDDQEVSIAWISNVSDEVKEQIVYEPEKWKHRVCKVQAMMIEEDTKKLRHGRIIEWRPEGDKAWNECDGKELFD